METFESQPLYFEMKNRKIHPPRLADKLLKWYGSNASIEDLHGDAEELFQLNLLRMSVWRAKANYWKHILSLMFSYAVKKRRQKASYHHFSTSTFQPAMLKNYFIIASRNLVKHKFFTIINVLGLAIGMSISLLLIAMLTFLWTYDNFHANKERIYRVITQADDKQRNLEFASAPSVLADKLQHELTGINEVVRISSNLSTHVVDGNREIPIEGYFVDANFLDVFTFPLAKGSAELDKQNSILITRKAAEKIFGDEDPVGKVIELSGIGLVEISGLLQNPPRNSHMQFEALASYQTLMALERDQKIARDPGDIWEYRNSYVYLLLPEKQSIEKIENFLNQIPKSFYSQKENFTATFELQALPDIAPGPELYDQIGPDWGYASLSIFIVLTLLILLPACFNYANISISRALKRMKEIGLRKTMGGQRHQIFTQFITETLLITFLALALSYYIFTVIRGEFLAMIINSETLDLSTDFRVLIAFVLFTLLVGFGAGVIPAAYFSKLNPIEALKSRPVAKGFARFNFRKVLIVSQFALSLGFIMGVVVVLNQYRYALNYDFGFNTENILDIELQGSSPQLFKNEFSKLAAVQSISMSSGILGTVPSGSVWVKNVHADSVNVAQLFVDDQFVNSMNLSLLAGKNFSDDSLSKNYIIVNEEFLKAFKLPNPESALNQTFMIGDQNEVMVIGVIKNFHYSDLRAPIRSFFFRYDPRQFQYANLNVTSTDMLATLYDLEVSWKKLGNEKKFMARFFDDEIEEVYSVYFSMIKICGFLGFLAISISCLGLLGMVVFTIENRMKEVGVRKVMGASALSITVVLSKDFFKLMVIAALIAIPISYFVFDKIYLQTQYYHITVGAFEIIVSLLTMLVLGLTTILSQTVKAAQANPVDTLRYE